ncbi:MAG: DUF5012 domain-containing protein [Bacteroidaceae bacterium]|nr:DUF5012 domain-containing protein [Bacteroidaceae bacterium]
MKKFLIYSFSVSMMALGLFSCNDDNDDHTDKRVTYYATLNLDGEEYMVVDKGATYVEPGFSAEMKGEDVTDQVVVNSNVDTSTSGVYSVTYSITNADGFTVEKERTVVVLDPNDPIEGFYQTSSDAYRDYGGTITQYGGPFEILVINKGDYYFFDDLMAGWYCQRAGYGSDYSMESAVTINDDGSLNLIYSYVPGWGDAADDLEGTYDSATGQFSYVLAYAGIINFHVTLEKVNLNEEDEEEE